VCAIALATAEALAKDGSKPPHPQMQASCVTMAQSTLSLQSGALLRRGPQRNICSWGKNPHVRLMGLFTNYLRFNSSFRSP